MVKLDHDDVAQNADMGSVYDRLAEHFERHKYPEGWSEDSLSSRLNSMPPGLRVELVGVLASDMVEEQQN